MYAILLIVNDSYHNEPQHPILWYNSKLKCIFPLIPLVTLQTYATMINDDIKPNKTSNALRIKALVQQVINQLMDLQIANSLRFIMMLLHDSFI